MAREGRRTMARHTGRACVLLMSAAAMGMSVSRASGQEALEGGAVNPHGDVVFRATGTSSCRDCHASDPDGRLRPKPEDNEAVRALVAKGKGAHGPGRFADCFRCHPGGRTGAERTR